VRVAEGKRKEKAEGGSIKVLWLSTFFASINFYDF
jgi:hypothetical protein